MNRKEEINRSTAGKEHSMLSASGNIAARRSAAIRLGREVHEDNRINKIPKINN